MFDFSAAGGPIRPVSDHVCDVHVSAHSVNVNRLKRSIRIVKLFKSLFNVRNEMLQFVDV